AALQAGNGAALAARAQAQREAAAAGDLAADRARRDAALVAAGLLPAADAERLRLEAAQRAAAAAGRLAAAHQQGRAGEVGEEDRRSRLAELERQRLQLVDALAAAQAEMARRLRARERRRVRAPIAGTLAELTPLAPGAAVAAGTRLATILPRRSLTPLTIVAWFSDAALGRLRPGQPARVRLLGSSPPAAIFAATVSRVGGETRNRTFRIELRPDPPDPGRPPLAHAQPAAVEVEVGRQTLAALLLGDLARSPRSAARPRQVAGRGAAP
ncbi:MAG TPA: HlyD family secretion protein, partial [Thermoanaerobaculia bacterium]|nr:HlyD family secretion protein [Thermoanaerobaculia bacterium]